MKITENMKEFEKINRLVSLSLGCNLPHWKIEFCLDCKRNYKHICSLSDTVIIYPEERRVWLLWHKVIRYCNS